MGRSSFIDRLLDRIDDIDSNSIQAYILRLSKEKGFLETVFNTIKEGILVVDAKLHIRYHNKAAKKLLGLPEDLEAVRLSKLLREVDWTRILAEDEEEWYRVSRQEIEILYPKPRLLHFYLVPHDEMKGTATVILNDVTESRERSREGIESEKIQFISMLAASVAHEIGNPLNSIYLHLQLMERQVKSDSFEVEEFKEMLDVAKSEVERLDTLISQFLTALRPAHMVLAPVNLTELVIESLRVMKLEIQNRSIEVNCILPEEFPSISGDAGQLKQAFYNILKNAMQAMPEGGSIGIECSYDDNYISLEMSDTGVGISVEDMSDIFSPFHTSKDTGNGLGLLVVERVLREHGAELIVNSKPGNGTSFIIKFPRHERITRLLPNGEMDSDEIITI